MIITKLEWSNKKKCRVYLNDEPAFWLYSSEISKYHLKEEQDFSEELYEEIYGAVLPKQAKLRCMNLLQVMEAVDQTGAAILLVTHDEQEANRLGCRILRLQASPQA